MDADSLRAEIGKRLQWLRKSLLLTQYQLASFKELDYRHDQNIETGRVEVKVETLKITDCDFAERKGWQSAQGIYPQDQLRYSEANQP